MLPENTTDRQQRVTSEIIRTQAIRIGSNDAEARILALLKPFRVVAVGEMHGTKEIPEFVGTLAKWMTKDGSPLTVGLEIPEEHQYALDQFTKTKDQSILQSLPHFRSNDGRGSKAMASLLQDLSLNSSIRILAFDNQNSATCQECDEKMAATIARDLKIRSGERVLLLAGNVHSSMCRGNHFDPTYRPMAYILSHEQNSPVANSEICSILATFQEGQSWCMMEPHTSPPHTFKIHHDVYCDSVDWQSYFLLLPAMSSDGYKAVAFIRRVTASEPLVRKNV